ncbi:hypothetical protein HORIV_68350 [Vreelandella olivaria]|uniref:Transposase n=1 Tax=Vreelandella olivaria TaxID=390919 RepID=A0ABM7GJ46_9GAMM|nr:hypothetical protein HORIV_31060 [Halomonas olivaria]BBI54414.1 hypothetical protein HORIV_68350 [Halomonas olivaria]
MAGRYEISDQGWELIKDIVVSPAKAIGRPRRDDRQMLNGIFGSFAQGLSGVIYPTVTALGKRFMTDSGNGAMMALLKRY